PCWPAHGAHVFPLGVQAPPAGPDAPFVRRQAVAGRCDRVATLFRRRLDRTTEVLAAVGAALEGPCGQARVLAVRQPDQDGTHRRMGMTSRVFIALPGPTRGRATGW